MTSEYESAKKTRADHIAKINSDYETRLEREKNEQEKQANAIADRQAREGALKVDGPLFITALHNALAPIAAEASKEIKDPLKQLRVKYGASTRQVVLYSGLPSVQGVPSFPCSLLALSDSLNHLVAGTFLQPTRDISQRFDSWTVKDRKIQPIRNNQPITTEAFAQNMVDDFLAVLSRSGR